VPLKLSIANQKGGVGKTSTALALSFGIAQIRKSSKVLFIDLDAQGNASAILGKNKLFSVEQSIFSIFSGNKLGSAQIHSTELDNLFFCPSSLKMAELDSMLANKLDGFFRLNDGLSQASQEFEFIIMDCPPSLSLATINSLVTANHLIIPLQVSKFSLDGIQVMQDAVKSIQNRYNPRLNILGGLLTMFDARTTLAQAMIPELEKHLHIFTTRIPKSVMIEEAHLVKEDIYNYAPKHKVSKSYHGFCEEVLLMAKEA
jgi:chromosome partitioning protein